MTQVVIVGSGPTGAALALLLVKRGISVTLVEAAKDSYRVFRGEAFNAQRIGCDRPNGLIHYARRCSTPTN